MLVVMDKSTHEKFSSQPPQTKNKQLKMAVTFLTGYNGIFKVSKSNKNFYLKNTITNKNDFIQITIKPSAYELQSINDEIKRIITEEGYFTEASYPFMKKPNFSTVGDIIEIQPQGPIIAFVFEDSIRKLLGFYETILYKEYNLSPNPVDSFGI